MASFAASERSWKALLQQYGLLLSFVALCLGLSLATDRFLRTENLLNVLRQASINGIIAVGMLFVILTRGIDLSVGAVLALACVVTADLLGQGWNPLVALLLCLILGGSMGLVSGTLITRLNIPPFIATLGMMTIARGLALSYTEGQPVTGLPEAFRWWGSGTLAGIPVPIFLVAGIFLAGYILLENTAWGRHIFAYGDNPTTALYSGLSTHQIVLFVYVLSGVLAALAGVVLIGRLNSAAPTAGEGYEFDAIAAVVVGGTSFDGGQGSLWGTILGVLLIAVLNNGMNLLNVPSEFQTVVKGAVIALALLFYKAIR